MVGYSDFPYSRGGPKSRLSFLHNAFGEHMSPQRNQNLQAALVIETDLLMYQLRHTIHPRSKL